MNKFTLRFDNAQLESEYQKTEFNAFRSRTNSYFLMIFFLICCLNFSSQFIYVPENPQHFWPLMNILSIVFIYILARKYPYFGKQMIFLECMVAISTILEIIYSHNMASKYFNQILPLFDILSNLHLLQIFDFSFLQILLSMGFKIYFQQVNQLDVNWFTVLTTILSSTIQIVTVYQNKQWSRQQFILYMKDQIQKQQLQNIISKPFFKMQLEPTTNNFVSLLCNKIDLFPGFKSIFCDSCNLRVFLRQCQNQNLSLEQKLLNDYQTNKNQITQQNYQLTYQYNQQSFIINICNQNLERFECLIILEQCDISQKQVVSISNIKKAMLNSLTSNSKYLNQKFFKLGVLTIIHFNNKQIGIVNAYDLMKKIISYFDFLQIDLSPNKSSNLYLLSTYKQQLFIFMICIFNIFTNLTRMKNSKVLINISNDEGTINIKIYGINQQLFLEQFKQNVFLMQSQKQLLKFPINKNLTLKLSNPEMQ